MRDPFANYDAWLERPYQEMMDQSDEFYDWADAEGYDLDDPDQLKDAEDAYLDWCESMAEADAEAKYEAYMDRLESEHMEREYDYEDRW